MSGIAIFALEIIAPIVILIVYGRIKIARAKRKALDDVAVPAPPFEYKPEPVPGFLLRYFSVPQRAYLRQQIALGKAFYYIASYIFVAMFTFGLLPPLANRYELDQPLAQRVWYSYLDHISFGEIGLAIIMLMAAAVAASGLTSGAPAIFNRTRPLTHRFLFWARVLSAIATIFASLATALSISFVLLLLFYGPVWLHLMDNVKPGTVLLYGRNTRLIQLLQTSAPRLFLSRFTSALLIFSAAILIPSNRLLGKRSGLPIVVFVSVFAVEMTREVHGLTASVFSREFFLYAGLGPPPPYAYVFVPILLSAALLFIAQLLVRRVEL